MYNKSLIFFLIAITIAVCIRLSTFVIPEEKFTSSDASDYHALALSIINNGTFAPSGTFGNLLRMSGLQLSAERTPGYPLFLAFFYFLFGVKIWPVLLAQLLLDVGTIIAVYFIAKEISESYIVPIISSFFCSLNIELISSGHRFLTETLFTFVFTLAVLVFIKSLNGTKLRGLALSGFLMGLATLIRPILQYFPVVLIVALFLRNKKVAFRNKLYFALVLLMAFFSTISPWQYRNFKVFGHYSLTSEVGTNFLLWHAAPLRAYVEHVRINETWNSAKALVANIANPFERAETSTKIALGYISENPHIYALLHLKGIKAMFLEPAIERARFLEFWGTTLKDHGLKPGKIFKSAHVTLTILLFVEYLFLIIAFIVMCSRKNERFYAIFFTLVILYFANCTGIIGYSCIQLPYRFRVPIVPICLLMSAKGIYEIFKISKKTYRRFRHPIGGRIV